MLYFFSSEFHDPCENLEIAVPRESIDSPETNNQEPRVRYRSGSDRVHIEDCKVSSQTFWEALGNNGLPDCENGEKREQICKESGNETVDGTRGYSIHDMMTNSQLGIYDDEDDDNGDDKGTDSVDDNVDRFQLDCEHEKRIDSTCDESKEKDINMATNKNRSVINDEYFIEDETMSELEEEEIGEENLVRDVKSFENEMLEDVVIEEESSENSATDVENFENKSESVAENTENPTINGSGTQSHSTRSEDALLEKNVHSIKETTEEDVEGKTGDTKLREIPNNDPVDSSGLCFETKNEEVISESNKNQENIGVVSSRVANKQNNDTNDPNRDSCEIS